MDKDLQAFADTLIKNEDARNILLAGVDDVFNGRWELPPGMPDWVQKVVMMDGYDAVQTAVRVMSQWKRLEINVLPQQTSPEAKDRANDMATALKWQLLAASKRNDSNILHDIAFSAVQYAMTCVEVVYLPYQKKIMEDLDISTAQGDFSFIVHNPANVFPHYTIYGIEGVLIRKLQTAKEFKGEWGKLAKKVLEKDSENQDVWVTSFDYRTKKKRTVWGIASTDMKMSTNDELPPDPISNIRGLKKKTKKPLYVIMDEKNEFGFIPFAIRRWGNTMSNNSAEKLRPLLGSMWTSKQYHMLNIYASMDGTLAWKRAAAPVLVHESQIGDKLKLDYTEPIGIVEAGPGSKVTPLPSQSVDQRLSSQYANFRSQIWQSTIARALQSLEFPSGTAFSSINQVLSAATASLDPYKTVEENTISDVLSLMLLTVNKYGEKFGMVDLYGEQKEGGGFIRIPSDTIAPDALRIEVIVTPNIPLDEQAKANTAVMLKRDFQLPSSRLLKDLGFEDVDELFDERQQEDLELGVLEVEKQRPLRDMEQEYQERATEHQAGIQQQLQQQQQQQEQLPEEVQEETERPISENLGGLGFNTAMGGEPPIQGAPGQLS